MCMYRGRKSEEVKSMVNPPCKSINGKTLNIKSPEEVEVEEIVPELYGVVETTRQSKDTNTDYRQLVAESTRQFDTKEDDPKFSHEIYKRSPYSYSV